MSLLLLFLPSKVSQPLASHLVLPMSGYMQDAMYGVGVTASSTTKQMSSNKSYLSSGVDEHGFSSKKVLSPKNQTSRSNSVYMSKIIK